MNSYNISLWENTRRLRVLGEFRNDVVAALEDVHQLPPVVLPGLGVQTELATCPSRLDPWFSPLNGSFQASESSFNGNHGFTGCVAGHPTPLGAVACPSVGIIPPQ